MPLRSPVALAVASACALAPAGAALAQAAPEQPAGPSISSDGRSLSGLNAAQLFDIADQARIANRLEDAEAIYRALAGDPAVEVRSEARFRLGMMYADQKRYTDAALAFRAILDEQPEAARVRLELARVLVAMGDEGGARQQVRQAQAGGLPADVAQVVDQFATALRSTKRFGGTFEAAIAPDSNINRATDAKVLDTVIAPFVLSDDARSQSGLGAHLSGQLYARFGLAPRLSLVPRVTADATLYGKSQFNDVSGTALVGLEWLASGRDKFTPSAGFTWRTYGGKPYAQTVNADLRWSHRIDRRSQLDTGFSFANSSYSQNNQQDGNLYNLTVGLEHALSPRSGVGVSVMAMRQDARDPGYSTLSGGFSLLGWRDMGKLTVFANATVRRLESDAAIALYGDRRKEWFLRTGVGATFRQVQIAGFSPVVRAAYERNIANIAIYDYRRFYVDFGITRAF